ncbi:MAG: hypothetical protein AB7G62_01275 [Magnetospirillum sp.]
MKWQDEGFNGVLVSTVPDCHGRNTSLDIFMAEGREGLLIGLPEGRGGIFGFTGFISFTESWPKTLVAAKKQAEAMVPPSPMLTILQARILGLWSIVWWRLTRIGWQHS